MNKPDCYFLGEDCLCWQFGNDIDLKTNRFILNLYHSLKQQNIKEIHDIVPAYNSIAVHFNSDNTKAANLKDIVTTLINKTQDNDLPGTLYKVDVNYNGEDLNFLGGELNLSIAEIIKLHSQPTYQVAMIGFVENFPYLLGLDKRLEIPRRESPRLRVPSGSVAIGGQQTGIYPVETPGGWHIIGTCNPDFLTRLEPGDMIKFNPVEEIPC